MVLELNLYGVAGLLLKPQSRPGIGAFAPIFYAYVRKRHRLSPGLSN
jgi:hypothetical protein